VERIAFLKFDDLTGDPMFAWIAGAAPAMLARDVSGTARTLALAADTVRDAYLQRATRMVHGYVDLRAGKLHFEVVVEDVERHKMIQTVAAEGSPFTALNGVAKAIEPGAGAFASSNNNALAAWAKGDDATAVMLDPDFGPAWLAWCQQLAAAGKPQDARETAEHALARTALRSPTDRAQIQVLLATLQHDEGGRLAAIRELIRLLPADPSVHRSLGEAEMQARRFPEAAAAYRAALQADPADVSILNLLGYAEAFSGNLDEARKAFAEYARDPNENANALDSLGEALFLNGRFQEAEQVFVQDNTKAPGFQGGETLWKAAHARWLGGDLPGADGIAQRYFEQRTAQRDPLTAWRRANWMYETGRRDQAVAILSNPPPELAELAKKQIAVWNDPQAVPRDLVQLKQAYERAAPSEDGLVRTFYAAALLRAGMREDARKLVGLWPLPNSKDALQALMYPTFLELRRTLQ
jgi:tetratricopeptide (TPR) repeat protein